MKRLGETGMAQAMLVVGNDISTISDVERVASVCMPEIQIVVADELSEAPSLIEFLGPSIVILDLYNEYIDDLDPLLSIRKGSPSPIMTMSYMKDESLIVQALENGSNCHIAKPIQKMKLVARIHALERRCNQLIREGAHKKEVFVL